MKKILILIFLASIPILYLCAHNRSFRMTRQIADLEEEKKLLAEQLEQLRTEAAKAYSYSTVETKAIALGLTFTPTDSSNRLSGNLTSMANKALSKKK